MRCAFGKNVGTAARVKRGQRVISIQVNAAHYLTARDALRKASMKFLPRAPSASSVDTSTSRVSFEQQHCGCDSRFWLGIGR